MPRKRKVASWVRSASCIVIHDHEEIARHLLQDQFLEAPQIAQAIVGGLTNRRQEGLRRIGALQIDQATQRAQTATLTALLEGTGIRREFRRILALLDLQRRQTGRPDRCRMMLRNSDADIAFADHTPMRCHPRVAIMDLDSIR